MHFQDNLKPEFKAKFPHGKIPAYEDAEKGVFLFEGAAILKYGAFALHPSIHHVPV